MWGFSKKTMITKEDALPGRDQPLRIHETHVVLDTPLRGPWPENLEVIYFGMGCFWGAERLYWQTEGVYSTSVGYMGGWTKNPTYEETCTARTGHTETVQVVYDPAKVALDELFRVFWENHDPTTPFQQGGDIGTQYRSAIFTTTPEQLAAAEASRERYQHALKEGGYSTISTEIRDASDAGDGVFYFAEDYHQGYLYKNPRGYCNHGFCQTAY